MDFRIPRPKRGSRDGDGGGDVVLVIQPDTPRGRWPSGRIAEVYPGRDGHTRVAKVVCAVKTVGRRITKLIPLGINF